MSTQLKSQELSLRLLSFTFIAMLRNRDQQIDYLFSKARRHINVLSVCGKSREEPTCKYLDAGLDFGRMLFIKLIPSLTVARGTYSSSFDMYFVRFSGTVYLMYPALDKKNTLGLVLPFYCELVISYLLYGINC